MQNDHKLTLDELQRKYGTDLTKVGKTKVHHTSSMHILLRKISTAKIHLTQNCNIMIIVRVCPVPVQRRS